MKTELVQNYKSKHPLGTFVGPATVSITPKGGGHKGLFLFVLGFALSHARRGVQKYRIRAFQCILLHVLMNISAKSS